MNTKQLRQKILDLAIRGKLVPQDPNDEPASVLLERVRAEKERLIREGKIKRDKRDSAVSRGDDKLHYENVPFEVPESWCWATLNEVCSVLTDGTHQTPTYSDDGYIFLSSKNVTTGKIDWDNVMHIPESLHNELHSRLAPEIGDILLAKNGTTGFAAVVDRECIFDIYVSLALLRTFKNEISPEYLRHIISSQNVQEHFKGHLKGIGVPNLHLEHIRTAPIPVCSLAEQCRIVAAIESAFAVIDEIERNKSDLQAAVTAAKSKILSLAIRGKLVPQDPADEPASVLLERICAEREALVKAGKIKRGKGDSVIEKSCDNSYYENLPDGWDLCRLNDIGQIVGGGTPSTTEPSFWDNGSIPWITPADLSGYNAKYIAAGNRMITTTGLSESSAVLMPADSVLFSSRAPIGYCVIAKNEVCTNQGFKSVVPFLSGMSEYIYHYLKARVEEIRSRASGTTFKEVSGTEFGNTVITLPPIAEQRRIVEAIEVAFNQLNQVTENLD